MDALNELCVGDDQVIFVVFTTLTTNAVAVLFPILFMPMTDTVYTPAETENSQLVLSVADTVTCATKS